MGQQCAVPFHWCSLHGALHTHRSYMFVHAGCIGWLHITLHGPKIDESAAVHDVELVQDAKERRLLAQRGSSGSSQKRSGPRGMGAGSGGSSVKLSADDLKQAATVMEVSRCGVTGVPVSGRPQGSQPMLLRTPRWCVEAVHADGASIKAALPRDCTQLGTCADHHACQTLAPVPGAHTLRCEQPLLPVVFQQ